MSSSRRTGLRVVQLNLAYDAALRSADALIDRYATLTGWARAMSAAGADVHVVQRFATTARIARGASTFEFVADDGPPRLDAWVASGQAVRAAVAAAPDVVHVNGLMFPATIAALRTSLPQAAIVLQDHSGHVPALPPWPLRERARAQWAAALSAADALSFTARELAAPWRAIGLPESVPVLELLESSVRIEPTPPPAARARTGIGASPAILWVGRLNNNKDPLTLLDALELALPDLPGAACWMIYTDSPLERRVRDRIGRSAVLKPRTTLVGAVAPAAIADYYGAADIFVSASRHEGSGYALIEAMASGVTPVVTDIPAFRAITGQCGARWPPGSARACAEALRQTVRADLEATGAAARTRFAEALSWSVIANRTLDAYADLADRRAETSRP